MTDLEGGALPLVFDSAGFSDIPGAPPFSAYDLAALPVCEAFWLGERPRPAIVLTLILPRGNVPIWPDTTLAKCIAALDAGGAIALCVHDMAAVVHARGLIAPLAWGAGNA
jgi:hypothetical protein